MRVVDPLWYELRNAAYTGDFEAAGVLLRLHPHLRDATNSIGETVLHFLAVEDCRPAIEWLHGQGFDLNARNDFGTPLLFEVAELGYKELFLWLVEHGANLFALNQDSEDIVAALKEREKREMAEFLLATYPELALHTSPTAGRA